MAMNVVGKFHSAQSVFADIRQVAAKTPQPEPISRTACKMSKLKDCDDNLWSMTYSDTLHSSPKHQSEVHQYQAESLTDEASRLPPCSALVLVPSTKVLGKTAL
jgi:hypothetical protein